MSTEAWRRVSRQLQALEGTPDSLGSAGWLRRAGLLFGGSLALAVDTVAALLGPVVESLDATLGWMLSAALYPVETLFSIPYLGRALAWLHRVVVTVFWTLVGLPDALLCLLGVQPEKRLRVWILLPAEAEPDWREASILEAVTLTARILRREANIRLVPARPLQWDYAYGPQEAVEGGWIERAAPGEEPPELNVGCRLAALREDLGSRGARFAAWQLRYGLRGGYRRLTGWGPPIMVALVASVEGGQLAGCSLGPLVDYVTVAADQPVCMAHEIGHACNLLHREEPMNLMNPTCGGLHLNRWQIALLRLSRHVTYL